MRHHERRIDRLETSVGKPDDAGPQLLVVCPSSWPPEWQDRFDAARDAGDLTEQGAVIEAMTGRPPTYRRGELIIIRPRPDGPQ